MPKKPSLAASLNAVRDAPVHVAAVVDSSSDESGLKTERVSGRLDRKEGKGYFAATREGKKKATVTLTPEDHRRLKRLSADTGRSIELLMTEAVQNLFEKHNV